MAKGTLFGSVHSDTDLHLIQQQLELGPAVPRINLVDVPGGNGSRDLTEALGVGVTYKDRTIKWVYALRPDADWSASFARVSAALNGRACDIVLDDDPDWYYSGRVTVSGHKTSGLLRQISVTATCRPYKRLRDETVVSRDDIGTSYKGLVCDIGVMPLVPMIHTDQATTLKWGTTTVSVDAGDHVIPGFYMSGRQTIQAKLTAGAPGVVTVTWREGAL